MSTAFARAIVTFGIVAVSGCSDDGVSTPLDGGGGQDADAATSDSGPVVEPKGTVLTLLQGLRNPGDVAVDATHVYFSSMGGGVLGALYNGSVQRATLQGKSLTTVSVRNGRYSNLILDANRWFSLASIKSVGQRIIWRPKSGGAEQSHGSLGVSSKSTFALNAAATDMASATIHPTDWDIVSHALSGGTTTLVSSARAEQMLMHDAQLYWIDGKQVHAAPLSGGTASLLASFSAEVRGLAADSTHIYVSNPTSGEVVQIAKDGSKKTTLASGQSAQDIALRNGFVYWTNPGKTCQGQGSVVRVRRDGGALETVAQGLNCPAGIAVDDSAVYWVEQGTDPKQGSDGSLKKLAFNGG